VAIKRILAICVSLCLLAVGVDAYATDVEKHCDQRSRLVELLIKPPHYEQQALVLQDKMPGQGHRLELFMNSGENGRHSYTMIRTRRNSNRTCIVSAGLVKERHIDRGGREHLKLADENDPDSYEVITCHSYYVITRTFLEEDICDKMIELYGVSSPVASYGDVLEDKRKMIPWPENPRIK
jgi:hypothetical protein